MTSAAFTRFLQRFMKAERRAIDLADEVSSRGRAHIVDEADDLVSALARPRGFSFVHATSGGEGLDRISSGVFHYVMVSEGIADLPARTVARTIRNQHPDTVVLTFLGPADNGKVELVETHGSRPLLQPFNDAQQLIARLDELAEAWRAKARERRYTQAFREKHYDFLRRYVELKTKIDRAIHDGPG
jgi:DNA-binding response OmpR family regulator